MRVQIIEVWITKDALYDAGASLALWASGWRWNRLDLYSSVASPYNLTRKKSFSHDAYNAHDARRASIINYCEPGLTLNMKDHQIFLATGGFQMQAELAWKRTIFSSFRFATLKQKIFIVKTGAGSKLLYVAISYIQGTLLWPHNRTKVNQCNQNSVTFRTILYTRITDHIRYQDCLE